MILHTFARLPVNHIGACNLVDPKWVFCYNSCTVNKTELKMTRKHFIAMAKEISQEPTMAIRLQMAINFCKVAKMTNPRFDQARFLTACGV